MDFFLLYNAGRKKVRKRRTTTCHGNIWHLFDAPPVTWSRGCSTVWRTHRPTAWPRPRTCGQTRLRAMGARQLSSFRQSGCYSAAVRCAGSPAIPACSCTRFGGGRLGEKRGAGGHFMEDGGPGSVAVFRKRPTTPRSKARPVKRKNYGGTKWSPGGAAQHQCPVRRNAIGVMPTSRPKMRLK